MDKILNILIIEDSADDAYLIKTLLEHNDFKFRSKLISEKHEFLDAISSEVFDIILTDNSMFQFDSRDVLNFLKDKNIRTPLIVLSGTISENSAATMIREGAFDYVNKNDFMQVVNSIRRAVAVINQQSTQ